MVKFVQTFQIDLNYTMPPKIPEAALFYFYRLKLHLMLNHKNEPLEEMSKAKLVQIGHDLSKLVQTCVKLFKLVSRLKYVYYTTSIGPKIPLTFL